MENFDCARVACAKRTAGENGSSTAANTIEFRLIGNSIDARVACTLYQTNQQSYRVNRFGIKIVGYRGRVEESKSASSALLFDTGEVFSSDRPSRPRSRLTRCMHRIREFVDP